MTLILAGCKEWSTEQAGTWADKVLFSPYFQNSNNNLRKNEGKEGLLPGPDTKNAADMADMSVL